MIEKGRRKMIDGINEVSGRSDCREAVAIQIYSQKMVFATAAVAAIAMAILSQFVALGAILSGGLIGAAVWLMVMIKTETYWLGHCEGTVVLVRTNRKQNNAVKVAAEYPYPVAASIDSGRLVKKITLAGTRYQMARMFEDRFRAITGIR